MIDKLARWISKIFIAGSIRYEKQAGYPEAGNLLIHGFLIGQKIYLIRLHFTQKCFLSLALFWAGLFMKAGKQMIAI